MTQTIHPQGESNEVPQRATSAAERLVRAARALFDRGLIVGLDGNLSLPSQGSAVVIANGGPNLGLPVVEFELGPYWDEHYPRRLFFAQKARWQTHWDQRRPQPEWREPAPRR